MVSYYLPVHFIALNAILKKIIGGGGGYIRYIRYITAKYGLKPSNNKGDIQGRP